MLCATTAAIAKEPFVSKDIIGYIIYIYIYIIDGSRDFVGSLGKYMRSHVECVWFEIENLVPKASFIQRIL